MFQYVRIGPGTQQLLIQVFEQLRSIGKPHEELVREFEKEVREFKEIGFRYERTRSCSESHGVRERQFQFRLGFW